MFIRIKNILIKMNFYSSMMSSKYNRVGLPLQRCRLQIFHYNNIISPSPNNFGYPLVRVNEQAIMHSPNQLVRIAMTVKSLVHLVVRMRQPCARRISLFLKVILKNMHKNQGIMEIPRPLCYDYVTKEGLKPKHKSTFEECRRQSHHLSKVSLKNILIVKN